MAILKEPITKYKLGDAVTANVLNDTVETAINANEKASKATNLQAGKIKAVELSNNSAPFLSAQVDTSEEKRNLLNLYLGVSKGERGSRITIGDEFPPYTMPGDIFIEKSTYDLYEIKNSSWWERVGTLKGTDGNVGMYDDPDNGLQLRFAEQEDIDNFQSILLDRKMLLNRDENSFTFKNSSNYDCMLSNMTLNQEGISITYKNNTGVESEISLSNAGIMLRGSSDYYGASGITIDPNGQIIFSVKGNVVSFNEIMDLQGIFDEVEEVKNRLNQLGG